MTTMTAYLPVWMAESPDFLTLCDNLYLILFAVMLIFFFMVWVTLQSGAFEVFVNGKLIYSKLKTGKLPSPEELNVLLRKNDLRPVTLQED